ncbi:MAG: hypothetical protein QOJ16_2850, partial [Acidobacteriota bacterium]|nr:hypothetical protein [Acidobacteriota bacterium]
MTPEAFAKSPKSVREGFDGRSTFPERTEIGAERVRGCIPPRERPIPRRDGP